MQRVAVCVQHAWRLRIQIAALDNWNHLSISFLSLSQS